MADTLDLLDLAEARDAVNMVAGNDNDAALTSVNTAVARRIDDLCGPVVNRTISQELHDGGSTIIWPRTTPVSSVTMLKEYSHTTETTLTAETNASKPANGYLLDDRGGHYQRIIRRSGNGDALFPSGRRNVEITYVAGRAANTGSVDPLFKEAAAAILRRLWQREAGAWARPSNPFEDVGGQLSFFKAVDPMVKELLADELLPPLVR